MNIFLTIAEEFGKRGDDMEDVARQLAEALKHVIDEGVGEGHLHEEIEYLLNPSGPEPAYRQFGAFR